MIVLGKSPVQPFSERGKRSASLARILPGEADGATGALERDGFEVVAGANVREALSRIAAESFDLLRFYFVTASPARPLGVRRLLRAPVLLTR